jgi:hypothetical protein
MQPALYKANACGDAAPLVKWDGYHRWTGGNIIVVIIIDLCALMLMHVSLMCVQVPCRRRTAT